MPAYKKVQVYNRGPKRRIERVYSRINHAITNTSTDVVLHTAEDRKTLVRTIIQLQNIPDAVGDFNIGIDHEPRGQSIAAPGTTQSLDIDMVKNQLWKYSGRNTAAQTDRTCIEVDLKSMRKLDPGDEIVLRDVSDQANSSTLIGIITMFFKE